MADDDEIDILGDFSFDSCLAQNNQGIPSCSNDDTVHPQWLLDSTETKNWYDNQSKDSQSLRNNSGPSRKLLGDHNLRKSYSQPHTVWSHAERTTLAREMAKYGRNVEKISQTLKSKTKAEIHAIIDAECGVLLETASNDFEKFEDHADIPSVGQEEVVTGYSQKLVVAPANTTTHPFRKKTFNTKSKNSLLKSNKINVKMELPESTEFFYEDDMIIGSTESIGSELDMTDIISKNIAKQQAKVKAEKKIGNHRRKASKNYDKGPKSKELLKSPQGRHRKDSQKSLSDDSVKSPKMQIVLGSGQALPVSEGEQVIKIEKKKDSEPESDIEIDIDSDNEGNVRKSKDKLEDKPVEEPIAVPLRKFEPMPRRKKKINLDGGGGYTIMHTEAGDLYEVGSEPRRERQPKKQPIHLIRCKFYNAEKPAPYEVHLHVSALMLMDAHAHSSRGEVMGLVGGGDLHTPVFSSLETASSSLETASSSLETASSSLETASSSRVLAVCGYQRAAAASSRTHCDMEPVSQAEAAARLVSQGMSVCGWHHSHPLFPCAPSAQDLRSQRLLQGALEWRLPLLGLITAQHWPRPRTHTLYRCLRVEGEDELGEPVGYQLPVKLIPDVSGGSLARLLSALPPLLRGHTEDPLRVDVTRDICPLAQMTYLEKFISSISHHMRSAGYADEEPIVLQLIQGIRDVFR